MSAAAQAVESIQLVSPGDGDFAKVWTLLQYFSKETIDQNAPKTFEELVDKAAAEEAAGGIQFTVLKDGEFIGFVWFENLGDELGMGHLVFERDGVNGAEKLRATKMAVDSVLESTFRKIMWVSFSDNRAYHIFLRKAGAVEEGTFREHFRRGDAWVDAKFMASFPQEK